MSGLAKSEFNQNLMRELHAFCQEHFPTEFFTEAEINNKLTSLYISKFFYPEERGDGPRSSLKLWLLLQEMTTLSLLNSRYETEQNWIDGHATAGYSYQVNSLSELV